MVTNISVVGCGYWGPNLIRNFNSLKESKVTQICDLNQERLKHLKSLYPETKVTTDFDDIIKNPDINAVVIATPAENHFEMARKSLESGKSVFIEKPMAKTTKDCEELIKIAEKHKLTIMIGHTYIYSSPVRKIKEIIKNGDLGEIRYISSRRLNLGLFHKDVNVVWDLVPHDLSILLFLYKDDPISVNCQGKAHFPDGIEDVANLTLEFTNGCFASIQCSWLDPKKVREMTFVGSRRMLVYDDIEQLEKIKIYDTRVDHPPHYDTFAEFHYSYHWGDSYSPYIKQEEPIKVECQHFLDCIKTGAKPDSSGIEGLKVVKILEATTESIRKDGNKVMVTY